MANHAVVIGGSMAGLVATRVLSDHFERVTLIERDRIREVACARKGAPQGRHLHGLLARGLVALDKLFPGIEGDLLDDGAVPMDMAADLHWYHSGGYKAAFESGLVSIGMTRPFLEAHVRARVLALRGVELRDQTEVEGWLLDEAHTRVLGVRLRRRDAELVESLHADLVVDCTGRGSRTPRWLEQAGFDRPDEEKVEVDVGYATRTFAIAANEPMIGKGIMTYPAPPRERRMGAMLPIEGGRWIVSLGGWGGDVPPHDEAGFEAFARSLPAHDIAEVMARSRPLDDIVVYRFPFNTRRRYERSSRFPERLVVLGDALCSFNPIYGQGMTLALLQAVLLGETLREQGRDLDGLPRRFLHAAAKLLDTPWRMATMEDLRFPTTIGHKPFGTDFVHWFERQMSRAAMRDPKVHATFLRVMNMIEEPSAMFRPAMIWRVLTSRARRAARESGG